MKDQVQLFENLLQQHLQGKASEAEYQQLMQLVKEGVYDEALQQQVEGMLQDETMDMPVNEQRAKEIFAAIITAEPVQRIPAVRRSIWPRLAGVAAVIATLLAGWWFYQQKNVHNHEMSATTAPVLKPAADSKGKKYIRFSDGSSVLLNEGSRIDFPDAFSGNTREVSLWGEGYFDIKSVPGKPFIVHAGKVNTTVLGTAFNVKAYPSQPVVVTVTRGKVKVADQQTVYAVLTANQQVAVNTGTQQIIHAQVDADKVLSWKKQYLVMNDISMEEAAALIGSKYNVHIVFTQDKLKESRISATFLNNESLEQVLTVVTGVVNATYTIQPNDQIILSPNNNE